MSPDVALVVERALAPLRERFPATRWIGPDRLHLTLVFLGARSADGVPAYGAALASVARRHAPIEVATGEAGGRATDRRGGVAWLRIAEGADALSSLALDVDQAIGAFSYGERLQPRPHLTVARRVDETTLAALREWAESWPPFHWRVDRIALFRSYLGPKGSRYEELATSHLTGAADPA